MAVSETRLDSLRPVTLYYYGERMAIERAQRLGEFRLRPNSIDDTLSSLSPARTILPFRAQETAVVGGFLTMSLSTVWDENLSLIAPEITHCLVINNSEQFGERVHRAVQKILPQWAGIDAAIAYGKPSPLGAVFTKAAHFAAQKEWLFAWRPIHLSLPLQPIVVQIGCIDTLSAVRTLVPAVTNHTAL